MESPAYNGCMHITKVADTSERHILVHFKAFYLMLLDVVLNVRSKMESHHNDGN